MVVYIISRQFKLALKEIIVEELTGLVRFRIGVSNYGNIIDILDNSGKFLAS